MDYSGEQLTLEELYKRYYKEREVCARILNAENQAVFPEEEGEKTCVSEKHENARNSVEPLLTAENMERLWKALLKACEIRGCCTMEEFAHEAKLNLQDVEALLKVWERDGLVYQPYPTWWKPVKGGTGE